MKEEIKLIEVVHEGFVYSCEYRKLRQRELFLKIKESVRGPYDAMTSARAFVEDRQYVIKSQNTLEAYYYKSNLPSEEVIEDCLSLEFEGHPEDLNFLLKDKLRFARKVVSGLKSKLRILGNTRKNKDLIEDFKVILNKAIEEKIEELNEELNEE